MLEKLISKASSIELKSKQGKPPRYKIVSEKNFDLKIKLHDDTFKEVQIFIGKKKYKSIWDSEQIINIEQLISDQIKKVEFKEKRHFLASWN